MGTNTSNYNLKKPSQEDFYNIEDQNANMDIIDAQLKSVGGELSSHLSDMEKIFIDAKAPISPLDSTLAFQTALLVIESLGGGTLVIPTGTYLISDTLYIPSHTRILGIGNVVLKRNSDTNAIMVTKSNGLMGEYTACKNITIENITFDGAIGTFTTDCTLFASGHASNINIKGCTFQNLDAWHMIELNATKDSCVAGCTFNNYGNNTHVMSEMLQLDSATTSVAFPWYGPWDNTSCTNIIIEKNVFKNSNWRAIGNHTFLSGVLLKDSTFAV